MARFTSISPAALMRLIGTPQAPVVLDVSLDDDVNDDPFLIPTARRWSHDALPDLVQELHGQRVVCICQKGRKLSHGAAALLRSHGIAAEALEGGNIAWRDADLPRVPLACIPASTNGTLWVTRHRPKIDRIACPWLIRRFVDPQARFLYVPASDVLDVASKFDATPFDVPGADWTHSGAFCTFDMMVDRFGLAHDALTHMADVIRAADTDTHDQSAQAAGLLALSVGLSRAYSDDLAQLDAGMVLYDALYRWARDGRTETHTWDEA